jgi:hypothetical protein
MFTGDGAFRGCKKTYSTPITANIIPTTGRLTGKPALPASQGNTFANWQPLHFTRLNDRACGLRGGIMASSYDPAFLGGKTN